MVRRIASALIAVLVIALGLVPGAFASSRHKRLHVRSARLACSRKAVGRRRTRGCGQTQRKAAARPASPTPPYALAPTLPYGLASTPPYGLAPQDPSSTTQTPAPSSTSATPAPTPPTTNPVSGGLVVGLDASVVGWSDVAGRFDQVVSATGAKWMRQDFFWSMIEPQPGVFDFSYYDQFVLQAALHNVHLLPLLFDTPGWAGANYDSIPADPSAYAAYVAAVVGRYGPHGSFWAQHPSLASYAIHTFELWNEPYYDNGNNGDYDPGRYARLVKAAAIAGRNADPDAKFLLAADTQAQDVAGTWVWWVDALYQAVPDLNNYFDGVAVHPYGNDLTGVSYPTPGQAYNGYEQVRRVEAIRQEFVNHNAADKPLWITEIGWPTCTSGSDRCTTPAGQAADLSTVFQYAHTIWSNFVQAVFVYSYDDAHPNSTNPEDNYGLAYNNETPKPALAVFQANAPASAN